MLVGQSTAWLQDNGAGAAADEAAVEVVVASGGAAAAVEAAVVAVAVSGGGIVLALARVLAESPS